MEKQVIELYGGDVKIEYNDGRHTYKLAGERSYLISATAATGIIDKSGPLMSWATRLAGDHLRQYIESTSGPYHQADLAPVIDEAVKRYETERQKAAGTGDKVHDFAEHFAKASLGLCEYPEITDDFTDEEANAVKAFLTWVKFNNVKFLAVEQFVYSKKHGYCGKFDAVIEIRGKKIIIDYKTSKSIYDEYLLQLSGYWQAYEEEHGKIYGGLIVHLNKETGNFEVIGHKRKEHRKTLKLFINCVKLKEGLKQLSKK